MSIFLTGVADLMVEECHTTMLHDDMTLARLMVYAQSIEDSKLRSLARSLKRSGASDQEQNRFNKKVQSQENLGVLCSRLRKEVVPRMASLLVPNVARNIMVSVYWVPGVSSVLVSKGTK